MLTAHPRNQINKMPVTDVEIYPSSMDMSSCLLSTTNIGMHDEYLVTC